MKTFIFYAAWTLLLLLGYSVTANNIQISNVTTTLVTGSPNYYTIQFNISWENSWMVSSGPANFDAAWLFVKFKNTSGDWKRAWLNTTFSNHTAPSGSTIYCDDNTGVFLYRSTYGSGNVSWQNVQLRWEYTLNSGVPTNPEVCVLGIEMVYIPASPFYLGDGNGANESTYALHVTDNTAVQITNTLVSGVKTDASGGDAQITGAGVGIDGDGGIDTDNNGTIDNASFPTGYLSFCIMKYEITAQQWCDFLNKLNSTEYASRTTSIVDNYGSHIGSQFGEFITNNPYRALGGLTWMDGCAYADWAGLRPMTELEYEKAC